MDDVEAHPRHYVRFGSVRAAARGAGSCGDGGQRNDDHRPGGRLELQHDEWCVRRGPQGLRAGVRQGGRAARHSRERRHDLPAGELEARRSAKLEARAVRRGQGESDGHASHGERAAHDRDQDDRCRDLMRRALGAGAVLLAALASCRAPASPPSGFTLLFLGRSPAASLDGRSWAPDPDKSRIVAFDGTLHVVRELTNPRLATPMAVASLGNGRLLVTERTGEGVVLDTTGAVMREWDSPDVASLYAAGGGPRVVATRSPYYVPQVATPEADTAPLIRVLDSLGHVTGGLAIIRQPALPILTDLVNAGAVTTGGGGGAVY